MASGSYYVPESTRLPVSMSLALFLLVIGAANWLQKDWLGPYVFAFGLALVLGIMFVWFRNVINEDMQGLYSPQMDRSFRWGMIWFIVSEVFFFMAFFCALFYLRYWSVPVLGGEINPITHIILWPEFVYNWPLLEAPDNFFYQRAEGVINPWGLPVVNTLILLASSVTITWAHWALKLGKRQQLVWGLFLTALLGVIFLFFQAEEYIEAYSELSLTLESGVYGSTFFMLTGFHGLHVTLGTIMLIVITLRAMKGHFTHERHFGFEAVAWYWHFVDVVWLFLFVFVYWL